MMKATNEELISYDITNEPALRIPYSQKKNCNRRNKTYTIISL